MIIKGFIQQYRRDFTALFVCEHCGHGRKGPGYDDDHFHHQVIPEMVCERCNKKADSNYRDFAPKYKTKEVI